MSRTFYVLRHGETRFNAEQRLQGHCNSELTHRGQQQAQQVGQTLRQHLGNRPYQVFCSSLGRAVQTAEIVCEQIGYPRIALHQDQRLMEFNLGQWEQRTIPGIMAEQPELKQRSDWYLHAPDSEPYELVRSRLLQWLEEQDQDAASDLVIITHGLTGAVLRGILRDLSYAEVWQQDIPQDAFYRIRDGQAERIDCLLPAPV
ncbi:histidine phosphatase family protein [Neptuniibacter halophilus]|uniref:histidine phosphatase family protein n=1 Tax=Neptuniibacter halophilus TaxID=651666 RepID=UPI002574879E|nr:histidine phosphatase family protein [Neptuniibacter halophilus]